MTDQSIDKPIIAEQLSGEHIWHLVRIAPGNADQVAVSGRLAAVSHTKGNLVRVALYVDENNTVELHLRSSVPIAFFHPAE